MTRFTKQKKDKDAALVDAGMMEDVAAHARIAGDFAEDPRTIQTSASDHHAVASRLTEHARKVSRCSDIPIGNHGNRHGRLADQDAGQSCRAYRQAPWCARQGRPFDGRSSRLRSHRLCNEELRRYHRIAGQQRIPQQGQSTGQTSGIAHAHRRYNGNPDGGARYESPDTSHHINEDRKSEGMSTYRS